MKIALFAALSGAVALSAQLVPLSQPPPAHTWESCEEMHDAYVSKFERSPGFGLSRMARPEMLDRSGVLDLGRTRYSIDRVELIGLMRSTTPVVYITSARSIGLRSEMVGSRELTSFEKRSVAAFRSGKSIDSAADGADTLACVGAVRAKDTCLNCHEGRKTGDLLGAFTYRLKAMRLARPAG
jgi:hypothetical protein